MYLIDYKTAVESILVPDKRTPKMVALNKALVNEIANDHDLLFNTYKNGLFASNWTAGTYAKGDKVKYGKSIFQSNINNNTDEPTYTNTWRLITNNFLGNDFRLKIRGEKLPLEYALNTWFDAVFRQPPLISDIYLTTNSIVAIDVFRVGFSEFESSKVYTNISSELVVNNYAFLEQYNLTINVPIALYTALADTNDARNSIIRNFADKYVNAGLLYKIQTY